MFELLVKANISSRCGFDIAKTYDLFTADMAFSPNLEWGRYLLDWLSSKSCPAWRVALHWIVLILVLAALYRTYLPSCKNIRVFSIVRALEDCPVISYQLFYGSNMLLTQVQRCINIWFFTGETVSRIASHCFALYGTRSCDLHLRRCCIKDYYGHTCFYGWVGTQ